MFDPNADPIQIAARAAELSLEQHDRLRAFLVTHPTTGHEFYADRFEAKISNQIASLMGAYAMRMGYVPVTPERIN